MGTTEKRNGKYRYCCISMWKASLNAREAFVTLGLPSGQRTPRSERKGSRILSK